MTARDPLDRARLRRHRRGHLAPAVHVGPAPAEGRGSCRAGLGSLLALALVTSLPACGKDGDDDEEGGGEALVGMYEVTRYALDGGGCGDGEPTEWRAPLFEVEIVSFFGVEALAVLACVSEDECDEGLFSAAFTFEHFDDDGGTGVMSTTWALDGQCSFTWREMALTATADGVRITAESLENADDVPGDDLDACDAAREAYSGAKACVQAEVLEGVRL